MTKAPVNILLVEDNSGDVELTKAGLEASAIPYLLSVVQDGVEAMAFLRREGEYHGAPRPDVVLLDLNLPRKDGRQVLEEIRTSADLRDLPVVILTVSQADRDRLKAHNLDANFMNKPVTAKELGNVLNTPRDFFATAAKPRKRAKPKE